MLDVINSFKFLKKLPIADYEVIMSELQLKIFSNKLGFPCWLKVSTPLHKAKINAIAKCYNLQDLEENYKKLKKSFPEHSIIIQKDFSGIEIILGLKEDKTFGSVLLAGSGGSFAETIKDISFRVCPLDKEEIEKMLKELKIYPVLQEKGNIKKLIELIEAFSKFEVKEADLNPVVVTKDKAVVVDARVEA